VQVCASVVVCACASIYICVCVQSCVCVCVCVCVCETVHVVVSLREGPLAWAHGGGHLEGRGIRYDWVQTQRWRFAPVAADFNPRRPRNIGVRRGCAPEVPWPHATGRRCPKRSGGGAASWGGRGAVERALHRVGDAHRRSIARKHPAHLAGVPPRAGQGGRREVEGREHSRVGRVKRARHDLRHRVPGPRGVGVAARCIATVCR
jgi:hypothetical protein